MKSIKIFSLALLLMAILVSYQGPTDRHVGTWEGIDDKGNKGLLTLKEDSDFLFTLIVTNTGSNDVVEEKYRTVSGKYLIDNDVEPINIELIQENENFRERKSRIKGIIRFIGDNRMELRISLTDECCQKFGAEFQPQTVLLNKISQATDSADH